MSPRIYKSTLAIVAALLMVGVSFAQRELMRQRTDLDLNRYTELKGAPPVLALTTVALGGFRGLISNLLWMRATQLQEDDKYFEMVQLADWITKLEPHFTQVWLFESWNMAYNISVKFKDAPDRWRWVQRGIELLRDEGLEYNPHDVLMHRELAGFFQHKIGANMDDAQRFYKENWATDMAEVLGMGRPNWDELINPKTEDQMKRAKKLREKYKLDPVLMKQVDEEYGPLEWKLPETHAIYWAVKGLQEAKANQHDVDPKDLITLHRMIYQCLQTAFQRGRLIMGKTEDGRPVVRELVPNLDIIGKASKAYVDASGEDANNRENILTAHRNFLRDAIYFLYIYNRQKEAIQWYQYLADKYPDKPLLEGKPNTLPRNLRLDDFVIAQVQGEVDSPGQDKAKAILEGLETTALEALAEGDDDRYIGLDALAQKVWRRYDDKIGVTEDARKRLAIQPIPEIRLRVAKKLLNGYLPPEMAAQLRTKLGLSVDALKPANQTAPSTTNSPAFSPQASQKAPAE